MGAAVPVDAQDGAPPRSAGTAGGSPSPTSPGAPGRASPLRTPGRSPAENPTRTRLRGPATGPGRRAGGRRAAAQGTRLANLRRRSRGCVYLGPLTPALPAGRGLSLVGLPAGRWRRAGTRGAPRGLRPGQLLRGRRAGRAGQRDALGGGGAESPCSPGPALAPPPPWGAPAAATESPASGAGGGEGRGRGKFEITPEPPLRPSCTGAASCPRASSSTHGDNQDLLNGEPAGVPQDSRLPLSLLSVPDPDPGPRNRVLGLDTGPREGSGPQQPLTPHPPPAARPPGRCGAPASQPPGSGLSD